MSVLSYRLFIALLSSASLSACTAPAVTPNPPASPSTLQPSSVPSSIPSPSPQASQTASPGLIPTPSPILSPSNQPNPISQPSPTANPSGSATPALPTTPTRLLAPRDLQVVAQRTDSITISWQIAEPTPHQYRVYLDGRELSQTLTGTNYTFTGLTPGQSYRVEVQAFTQSQTSEKVSLTGTTLLQGSTGSGGFSNGGSASSASITPTLLSLTPTRAFAQSTITLTGTGFDPNPAHNLVMFGTQTATVLAATPTSLKLRIPTGLVAGPQRVTVSVNGQMSSAQIFTLRPEVQPGTGLSLLSPITPSQFANSVDSAGDFNGDGWADLIIGAPTRSPLNRTNAGSAYILLGSEAQSFNPDLANLTATQGLEIQGAAASDQTGYSVAGLGDINGDGRSDVLVGVYQADLNNRINSGAAYVIYGQASLANIDLANLTPAQGFVIQGAAANDQFGFSVAKAGDINGDGRTDLIVSAVVLPAFNRGKTYVIYGTQSSTIDLANLTNSQGFMIEGVTNERFGASVAGAGDVNGDGLDDIIIGANTASANVRNSAGAAYVIYGSNSPVNVDLTVPLTANQGFIIQGAAANNQTGNSVAAAGDINRDGKADLVIGSYLESPLGRASAGASYIIYGAASSGTLDLANLSSTQGFIIQGAAAGDQAGRSVANAGDVNGDGRTDLIIGASGADPNGRNNAGTSYLIYGSANPGTLDLANLSSNQGLAIQGASNGDISGFSVASAGDLNQDGRGDLIIGAPYKANGAYYLVYGSGLPFSSHLDLGALTAPLP